MNPYLRLQKLPRPTAFYYAKQVLEGAWPETQAFSSIKPTVSVQILQEWPIGDAPDQFIESVLSHTATGPSKLPPGAVALMGVFLDNELVAQLPATKFLFLGEDLTFYYNWMKTTVNQESDVMLGTRPTTIIKGLPRVNFGMSASTNEDVVHLISPILFQPIIELMGDGELAYDIGNKIGKAYKKWQPPPPTSLEKAAAAISTAIQGRVRGNNHVAVACPRHSYGSPVEKVSVIWGLWIHKGFTNEKVLPLYLTAQHTQWQPTYGSRIFVDSKDAMEEALSHCEEGPPTLTTQLKQTELDLAVKETVEELKLLHRKKLR